MRTELLLQATYTTFLLWSLFSNVCDTIQYHFTNMPYYNSNQKVHVATVALNPLS